MMIYIIVDFFLWLLIFCVYIKKVDTLLHEKGSVGGNKDRNQRAMHNGQGDVFRLWMEER